MSRPWLLPASALSFAAVTGCGGSSSPPSTASPVLVDAGAAAHDSGSAPVASVDAAAPSCGDVTSDPANCGVCGNVCGAGSLCCASACVFTASCDFAVSQLTPSSSWVSGGTVVTVKGAGFAQGVRVTIGDGVAPAVVVDDHTLTLETPPGTAGAHDVSVTLAGATATLPGGYSYIEAPLASSTWAQEALSTGRYGPAMSVLHDGRALISGGTSGLPASTAVASLELYTEPMPMTVAVATMMSTPRFGGSAVTLLDGRVLLTGGACLYSNATGGCWGSPAAIDLFDPTSNAVVRSAASFPSAVVVVRGVLLADGRVFLVDNTLPSFAIYDPVADTLTSTPLPLPGPYGLDYPFLVRLRDGRVLFGAGGLSGVDMPGSWTFLFDPGTSALTMTGALAQLRIEPSATTLPDGRVLLTGGDDPENGDDALDSAETYDPVSGTFTLLPYKLSVVRGGHTAVLVRDGTVLAIGGGVGGDKSCGDTITSTATVDQIDPVKGTVTAFAPLPQATEGLRGIVMQDGSVLVGGGAQCGSAPTPYVDFLAVPPVIVR